MNPAQIMDDRKRIKDAINNSSYKYSYKLTTKDNEKRWCIFYYYYLTDENKGQDHMTIIHNNNKQIADILRQMQLNIKYYNIKASVWAKNGLQSTHIEDVTISVKL